MPPSLRNYVDLNIVSVSAKFDLGMIKFLFKTGEEEQGNISGILLQHYQKTVERLSMEVILLQHNDVTAES